MDVVMRLSVLVDAGDAGAGGGRAAGHGGAGAAALRLDGGGEWRTVECVRGETSVAEAIAAAIGCEVRGGAPARARARRARTARRGGRAASPPCRPGRLRRARACGGTTGERRPAIAAASRSPPGGRD